MQPAPARAPAFLWVGQQASPMAVY